MTVTPINHKLTNGITLYPMKKIEIIVPGEHEETVSSLLENTNSSGFTLIRHLSGKGHGGFHEGRLLFNDKSPLIMFIVVATAETVASIALGVKTLFEKNNGVMFVSDVGVARLDYFSDKT